MDWLVYGVLSRRVLVRCLSRLGVRVEVRRLEKGFIGFGGGKFYGMFVS